MGGNNANLLEDIRTTRKNLAISSEAITAAHNTFTNHYNTFLSLAEQFDSQFKELENRETAVEKRERDAKEKEQQLAEREIQCVAREKNADAKEREVSTLIEKWHKTEEVMKQNAEKIPNIVHFNISGTRFSVQKEIILQHKGSLFEQMITSSSSQQLPSTGEVFIGRDPKYVHFVISFILNGTLLLPSNGQKQLAIEREFEFFKIPCKFPFILPCVYTNNLVLEDKFTENLREWLPNKRIQLLYKASKDGFGAADFHKYCDNKGPTLTIIRSSNGYLFGGYSPLPWDSSSGSKNHSDAFIFTLTNPHNIPPTKYLYNAKSYAIYCGAAYGPIFGNSDIRVENNSNQTNSNFTTFPISYTDTTGKGNNTFTGNRNFTTSEIEVFCVL